MDIRIETQMQFPVAKLLMGSGDTARISNGSMIYRTQGVELSAKLNASDSSSGIGKFIKAAARSVVSGESVFITEVTCSASNGEIAIAPSCPGTIRLLEIGAQQYRLNDSAFLAMEGTVEYTMQKQSLGKALLGGSGGFFVMTTQGQGRMLVNSFGSIIEIDLQNEQGFAIDNGHVVAWDVGLDYEIQLQSGFLGSIGTGEGLVNVFKGSGKVLVSSLNIESFASRLNPFITKDS